MHHFMTWGAILLLAVASCQPAHRSQNLAATLPWSVDSLLHANHTPTQRYARPVPSPYPSPQVTEAQERERRWMWVVTGGRYPTIGGGRPHRSSRDVLRLDEAARWRDGLQ